MKTKILLVDDEEDVETLIRRLFRRQIQAGLYEFLYAHDGTQALTVLEQQADVDVVLSDINMPGMDGLTLLTRLPAISPFIQTVIVTAYGDMANIRTAMNRGAFDFITKPFNGSDLEVTLTRTIQHVRQLRETAELRALDALKTRFFANITHELRTPLSLILSPVNHLLETAALPPPHQQSLATVGRNAQQLLRLINQLLDIHKLEAGQMDLVNEVGDLPDFVGQIIDLFRPSADIKQLTLTYQPALPAGTYVFDAGKWETILYNLLANAIKFTQAGGVTVSLAQADAHVRLTVADTGIGIAADQLPHIFNRFYRAGSPTRRPYEGTGIGLALVQELTTRLGGTIRAESRVADTPDAPPSATQFVLDLPVERASDPAAQITPRIPMLPVTPPEHAPLPNNDPTAQPGLETDLPLILVVEDNAELREFIVAELSTTYRIRAAANGYEGWLLAKEELPAIVVSDLVMDRMNGYELLEQLKNDPVTEHIAVILLTAATDRESQLKGFALQADAYLTKPFHLGELHLRIRNLLHYQQKTRERYQQQLTRPDTALPPDTVQNQFLRRVYTHIEQQLDNPALSVEGLADQLAMSRKTLYRKVHTLTHLSPNELIRQYRLRKAVDLLRAGHNVSETAFMVGFDSPSYFTRVFRDMYQHPPTAYAKISR